MYATIASGGKQLTVKEGQYYYIESLSKDAGEKVVFDEVLCMHDGQSFHVGRPFVEGGRVHGEVLREEAGEKVRIIKFRRRQHSMTRTGHRQRYTVVQINKIEKTAKKATKKATKAVSAETATEE